MKKSWIAYIFMGLAISFLITYIIIDKTRHIGIESMGPSQTTKKNYNFNFEYESPDLKKDDIVNSFVTSFTISEIDDLTFNKMENVSIHSNEHISRENLRILEVSYYNFDSEPVKGQIIVHKLVAEEVIEIFYILYENKYLIYNIDLVYKYNGQDDLSMAGNNTHSFNDRMIGSTDKLSNHAYGLAIDINPIQNPYVYKNLILPENSKTFLNRDYYQQGMILKNDICYNAFINRGWTWGGDWSRLKDYQHFEKKIPNIND